jgi:hypothetical protein
MIIENILELSKQVFESRGKPADQVIISPFLHDLMLKEAKTKTFDAWAIHNGFQEIRMNDIAVVVSKLLADDEVYFKYKNGEFVCLKVSKDNLQTGKPTGGTVQLRSEKYRRITLGEE